MKRISDIAVGGFAEIAKSLIASGRPVDSFGDIPVYKKIGVLFGVLDDDVVFYSKYARRQIVINGTSKAAIRVTAAWRNRDIKDTAGFLLYLYPRHILSITGLAISAEAHTWRAERLSKRIAAAVPHAYAWKDGVVSELLNWDHDGLIVFSAAPIRISK